MYKMYIWLITIVKWPLNIATNISFNSLRKKNIIHYLYELHYFYIIKVQDFLSRPPKIQ